MIHYTQNRLQIRIKYRQKSESNIDKNQNQIVDKSESNIDKNQNQIVDKNQNQIVDKNQNQILNEFIPLKHTI